MEPVQILVIAAVLILVIGRRLTGQPLTNSRLLLVPAVMVAIGLYELTTVHLTAGVLTLLGVEAVVGLAFGVVRGLTIRVYPRAGHLWYRYTPLTIGIWVLAIAARVGVGVAAHHWGVDLPGATLLAALGLSLLGEAAIVLPRARRTGVPMAPDRRTARAAAGLDR